MVAPICVEDAELSLVGIASLLCEIFHNLHQVVAIHCQSLLLAISGSLLGLDIAESVETLHGFCMGAFRAGENVEILLSRLHGVDGVFGNLFQFLLPYGVVEDHHSGAADLHISVRLEKVDTFAGRSCALVELTGKTFHGQERAAVGLHAVAYCVCSGFAEYTVTALLQKFGSEPEEIIDAKETKVLDIKTKVGIQLLAKALGLDAVWVAFLNKNAVVHCVCYC